MAKPFDATLNSLIDARPEDWVSFLAPRLGLTPGPAEVLDTDLSATVQADKVFRLIGPPASLIHLELEANPRRGIPADLLRYDVLVGHGETNPFTPYPVPSRDSPGDCNNRMWMVSWRKTCSVPRSFCAECGTNELASPSFIGV